MAAVAAAAAAAVAAAVTAAAAAAAAANSRRFNKSKDLEHFFRFGTAHVFKKDDKKQGMVSSSGEE